MHTSGFVAQDLTSAVGLELIVLSKRLIEFVITTKSTDSSLKFTGRWSELFGDLEI